MKHKKYKRTNDSKTQHMEYERNRRKKEKLWKENVKEKLDNLEKINDQLRDILQFYQKIVENYKQLISQLPQNSPFRRSLLFWFSKDVSVQSFCELFGISQHTYNRLSEEDSKVLQTKYSIGVKRQRVTDEQIDEIHRILDDILPKQSGRDFRIQEVTDKKLYDTYYAEVISGDPVSKTFFIYNVLSKEKIEHSKSPKNCPICEKYDAGNRSTEIIRHKNLIPIQREQYSLEKKKIGSDETPKTALVT